MQIGALDNFFSERHLSEEAAKDAHKRVYYEQDGHNSGNRTLGGAAAYQAFLWGSCGTANPRWWDHEHSQLYHQSPTAENRDRLVALAIAECGLIRDSLSLIQCTSSGQRSTRAPAAHASRAQWSTVLRQGGISLNG